VSGAFLASYALLWLLVIVLTVAMFALYHHFGQMYLTSPEGRDSQGPTEGSQFPPLSGVDVNNTPVKVPTPGRPTLVVFASTQCELCAELRASLARFAGAYSHVRLATICAGHPRLVREWASQISATVPVIADARGRTSARYRVGALPFLVAVGRDGAVRARGIVNDYDGLELAAHEAENLMAGNGHPGQEHDHGHATATD
jgi:hypothetical protein